MPYLVFDDNSIQRAVPVATDAADGFKIGRSLENSLRLCGDTSVSRSHCAILRSGDDFVLKDFSSNGTLVGDNLVSGDIAVIKEGDFVTIGNFLFTFRNSDSPPCTPTDTTTITLPSSTAPDAPADTAPKCELDSETMEDDELSFQDTAQLAPIQPPTTLEDGSPEFPEIEGFEIIRALGTGNHSTTYMAFQAKLKRTVALKVFNIDNDGPRPLELFLESMQAAGSLVHKNIVPFFDAGHVNNLYFVVMHYASHGSLRHKIEKGDPTPVKTAIEVGTIMADALSQLKDLRSFHANITPNNILFGENDEPMLADTGLPHWIATVFQPDRNVFRGDPTYMSPEQALDAETDWTCDQYSLGVVLFEMLTGAPPFTASSPDMLIRKHLKGKIRFPDKPKIPAPLKNTLAKMMSKTPDHRFHSWSDVAAAMRAKPKSPPSSMPRPPKTMRKTMPNLGKPKNTLSVLPKRKKPKLKLK